jgi:hypothetical protein
MGQMGTPNAEQLKKQLEWLQAQVSVSKEFNKHHNLKDFILKDLDVHSSGEYLEFKAHIKDSDFLHRLNESIKTLPLYEGRRLDKLSKARGEPRYFFEWANLPPEMHVEIHDDFYYLVNWVKTHKVKEAIFIQQVGETSSSLRNDLLQKPGTTIKIYLQNPETACCEHQKTKINEFLAGFDHETTTHSELYENRVKLFLYDAPATLRAIRIDDSMLALGWYLYYILPGSKGRKGPDTTNIAGRHLPVIYAHGGSDAFGTLNILIERWLKAAQENEGCRQYYPSLADGEVSSAEKPDDAPIRPNTTGDKRATDGKVRGKRHSAVPTARKKRKPKKSGSG